MKPERHECQRCHGMMVESYSDVANPDGAGQEVIGRRCVNCGEYYIDRLVLLNRWAQQGVLPLPPQLRSERSVPRHSLFHATRRRRAAA